MAASREELEAMGLTPPDEELTAEQRAELEAGMKAKVEDAAERIAAIKARQHSPQEREIERFECELEREIHPNPSRCEERAVMDPDPDGKYVLFSAAQAREAELADDAFMAEVRAGRAERRLVEARRELERRAVNCAASAEGQHGDERDVPEGEAHAYREAAKLLDTSIEDREPEKCERCKGEGEIFVSHSAYCDCIMTAHCHGKGGKDGKLCRLARFGSGTEGSPGVAGPPQVKTRCPECNGAGTKPPCSDRPEDSIRLARTYADGEHDDGARTEAEALEPSSSGQEGEHLAALTWIAQHYGPAKAAGEIARAALKGQPLPFTQPAVPVSSAAHPRSQG